MDNDNVPKGAGIFAVGFILVWIVSALVSLGLLGVIIWAIIRAVLHFT